MSKAGRIGTQGEQQVVEYLNLWDPRVERRKAGGSLDAGDISGLPNVVIEVRNRKAVRVFNWMDNAEWKGGNGNAGFWCLTYKLSGLGYSKTRWFHWGTKLGHFCQFLDGNPSAQEVIDMLRAPEGHDSTIRHNFALREGNVRPLIMFSDGNHSLVPVTNSCLEFLQEEIGWEPENDHRVPMVIHAGITPETPPEEWPIMTHLGSGARILNSLGYLEAREDLEHSEEQALQEQE